MSKHTPGPWSYRKVPRKQEWEINTKRCPNLGHESWTGMSVVFGCDDYPKMGKIVGEANARLIAAAPELLDALKDALCCLEVCGKDYDYAVGKARAAIAKATGERAITLKFHNEESRDAFIRAERLDVAGTTPSGQPILVIGEKWELRIPANERTMMVGEYRA